MAATTRSVQSRAPDVTDISDRGKRGIEDKVGRLEDKVAVNETGKTGVNVFGDIVAWGSHFCLFYETKDDLLEALVAYCRFGLQRGEYCLWIVAEPLTIEEATNTLRDALPNLDQYLADSSLEIVPARNWYLKNGAFDDEQVTGALNERLARATAKGFAGVRVTGDMSWLIGTNSKPLCEFKMWKHLCEHEQAVNATVGHHRIAGLCTYPLAACGAREILDVVRTHQFAIARREGNWEIIETASLKQAKAEIKHLNEELEQRVVERTSQLMLASDQLHEARMELARANRVTMMGQLAASIVHEVNQPIAAAITNAYAALRWLGSSPNDLDEVRQALDHIIKAGNRASDVIGRIRDLVKKSPPRKERLKINGLIHEVIALTHSEIVKNGISVQSRLADDLPLVQGDKIQLQQVILNLIINAVESMSGADDGPRELLVSTKMDASSNAVLITVHDNGPGLQAESFDRLFDAFYTTKPGGMGMGLSICRSIVDAHGGRVWASRTPTAGATIQFTLPAE